MQKSYHEGNVLYTVFIQEKRGSFHQYVGEVYAPDEEMALYYAKEHFARRGPCSNIWVVKESHISQSPESWEEMFDLDKKKLWRQPQYFIGAKYMPNEAKKFVGMKEDTQNDQK